MSEILGPEFLASGEITTKWAARVEVASEYAGPWQVVPYLHPVSWSKCAAPEISKATFIFDYGQIKRHNSSIYTFSTPYDLGNLFVRIYLSCEYGTWLAWQGYMVDNTLDVHGEENYMSGQQVMQAYGLEYLFTKVRIEYSFACSVPNSTTQVVRMDYVPPFNQNIARGSSASNFGNRTRNKILVEVGDGNFKTVYLFSMDEDPLQTPAWVALNCLEYVIEIYCSDIGIPLQYLDTQRLLDSYQPTHSVEGMNGWEAINSIIPRQRGMLFELTHELVPTLRVQSVFTEDITFEDVTIPGNPEQYGLNFNNALDINPASIFMTTQERYKGVVVTGEKIRSCFTGDCGYGFGSGPVFQWGWDNTLETEYVETDLPSFPPEADIWYRRRARDKARAREKFSRVYGYWVLDPGFSGIINFDSVFPEATMNGGVDLTKVAKPVISGRGFLRTLPFKENKDYANGGGDLSNRSLLQDFKKPYATVIDRGVDGVPTYQFIHDLRDGKVPNFSLRMADNEYGVEIPNHNHWFAQNHFPIGDPNTQDKTLINPQFDWLDLMFTVNVELDQRLKVAAIISGNPEDAILYLHVPGAHCWVIHPQTIVDIEPPLTYQLNSGPSEARNDASLLRKVAAFAIGWYSTRRNLLRYTYRGLFPSLDIGNIITAAYSGQSFAQINTPITKKQFMFTEEPSVTCYTGFSELDLVGIARTLLPSGAQAAGTGAGNRNADKKARVPEIPSGSSLMKQVKGHGERIQRVEDHTQNLPVRVGGGADGGGFWDHVHSGATGDARELSRQRTIMQDDDEPTWRGQFGMHFNTQARLWFSDRGKWS